MRFPGDRLQKDALEDIHPGLTELERGVADEGKREDHDKGREDLPLHRDVGLERHDGREERVERVQHRGDAERDEDLPCRQNVSAGHLDYRRC